MSCMLGVPLGKVEECRCARILAQWHGRSAAQPCCALNLLEPRLMVSATTGIIPLDDRVILVNLLNCPQFSSRLAEVAQTLNAISGT